MEVCPQPNSLTTPDASLSCQHSGFPLCQKVSCSCRELSSVPSPPFPYFPAKPVDFTIATERTELASVVLGDDHLPYALSGFQVNWLGIANYQQVRVYVPVLNNLLSCFWEFLPGSNSIVLILGVSGKIVVIVNHAMPLFHIVLFSVFGENRGVWV